VIAEVQEFPTTHSGKRSERAARDAVNGTAIGNREALRNPESLDAIAVTLQAVEDATHNREAVPPGGTVDTLQQIWERVLGISPIAPDANFADLGGTSLLALQLFREVHEHIGVELPPSTLFRTPTIELMGRLLEEDEAQSPLVLLNDAEGDRPLFLIHGGFGDVMEYGTLAAEFGSELPVYGIRARGTNPHLEPDRRIEDMAAHYVEHVRRSQPDGPYRLLGLSLGGIIAFEMARELRRAGEEIEFLGIVDSDLHESILERRERLAFESKRFVRRILLGVAAPVEKFVPFARSRARRLVPWLPDTDRARPILPALRRAQEGIREAYESYRPTAYSGSASFFRATGRGIAFWDPHPAISLRIWSRVVEGGLSVYKVSGGHADCIQFPHAASFAGLVSRILDDPVKEAPTPASSPSSGPPERRPSAARQSVGTDLTSTPAESP
jgi:acetoacetyl-CoA synthetase